ncbi:MAG: electron transfer flavoprotein subunit alpha/FixB family protein [Gracilibacteraceae bacterium]|jgi:electron transfer flavoprotein alpha subunit|nr:electron transfer flavoprotein subunit alpha/FixB family protein [Gracilibacteraceae bacterium]
MSEIWIISEKQDVMQTLLAHAKALAKGELIVALTSEPAAAETASTRGADRVLLYQGGSRPEAYIKDWQALARERSPRAILLGAGRRAKEIAARLAAGLDAALISDCVKLEYKDAYYSERYLYGGLCLIQEKTEKIPFMATMAGGNIEAPPAQSAVPIEKKELSETEKITVSDFRPHQSATNLMEAKAIVCVGRGLARKEDLALAENLAKVLSAEIGCTRPVAEERQWLPEENYIGITGKTPSPDLYFGLGVSGQIQHISGVRDSKLIVAIEKNDSAPILKAADYTILGDLYEIVPQIIKALQM